MIYGWKLQFGDLGVRGAASASVTVGVPVEMRRFTHHLPPKTHLASLLL